MLEAIIKRLKHDKHGVSNVIVVMLSLVLIVVIVANVVLWSYQMNQFDWERMQENLEIVDVARVTNSSWFVAQNEYTVNEGALMSGGYMDTKAVDSSYETFIEAATGSISQQETLHPNAAGTYQGWSVTDTTHYEATSDQSDSTYVYTISVEVKETEHLDNPTFPESAAINWVQVWVRALDTGGAGEIKILERQDTSERITVNKELESSWADYSTAQQTTAPDGGSWTKAKITALEAGAITDTVNTEVRISEIWVVVDYAVPGDYELDLNGTFIIDMSTYSMTNIQSVEIQLRYRADDAGEKWYLKAYNWTSTTYSDSGFNSTTGHTPTIGWDYYAVNLTDQWGSYVQDDGTMYVKVVDEGADSAQTTIDIDFLAVRVVINGVKFTFQNKGSLTSHLVSLWVNNSTHHQRYDIDIFINSGETIPYIPNHISLPNKPYTVKVVTERGNIAVFTNH